MNLRVIVALVLVVLAVEAVVLYVVTRRLPRGARFGTLAPNLAAGAFLVLAIGATTAAAPLPAVALFVALGGIAHAVDLRGRLRRDRADSGD